MEEQCSLASRLFLSLGRETKALETLQSLSTKDLHPNIMIYSLFSVYSLFQVFCASMLSFLLVHLDNPLG